MPNFESGVSSYVTGITTVKVHFPVDSRGNADISCKQCPFFARYDSKCKLNDSLCNYPEKYVGANCPLTYEE